MTRIPVGLAAFILLLAATSPAAAHAPFPGLGSFYSGLLHPFLIPSHVLVLAGASLLIGQGPLEQARPVLLSFAVAYAIGTAATLWSASLPHGETTLLVLAALSGLLVAADSAWLRAAAVPIAVLSGVALGLDSGADETLLRPRLLMTLGTLMGGVFTAVVICALAVEPSSTWKRIGRRVIGSWTAASAVLVLALSLPRYR